MNALIRYAAYETRQRGLYAVPPVETIRALMRGRNRLTTLDIARRFHVTEAAIWNALAREDDRQ